MTKVMIISTLMPGQADLIVEKMKNNFAEEISSLLIRQSLSR
jgi:hypothetical protein